MRPIASRNFILLQIIICSIFSCLANVSMSQTVASFSASHNIGCAPLNVNFTNTSTGATSYSWNFGNSSSSTQSNPSNVYSTPGTYTVTLTATGTSGVNVTSMNITVVPSPIANFNVSQNVGCQEGDVFQFQNISSNYDSSLWDFGDGTTSNLQNPTHIFSTAGLFNIKLIVYNKALGCSDIKVKSSHITVHPKPESTINIDTIKSCDLNHQFNLNGQALTSVSAWQWDFGDGTTAATPSTTHTYSTFGSYQVQLITLNSFGCKDTTQLDSLVWVLSNPVPQIIVSGTSGCSPYNVSFQCVSTPGTNYIWDFDNGDSAATASSYTVYTPSGSYNPTLFVNYNNGCSNSVHLGPIVVDQSPQPTFIMTNYSGCSPLSTTFINNTPPGNFTWYWDFGDGTTSTLNNPTHVYDSIGYFVPSLVATSPNGCTNIAKNGWYYVNVNGPIAAFKPDLLSGCLPLTVNFTSNSTNAVQWDWNFGDGATSTNQHPSHIYQNLGTFPVTIIVTNAQGCKDTLVYSTNITTTSSNVNFVPPAPITACSPHTIHLADASGAASWLWDFGDGTTSTLANPFHTYTTPGTYTVSLTTWMPNGGCSYTIPNFQTFIIEGAVLGFTYAVSSCPPYEVFFTDTSSNASSWQWSFGDGGNSTQQNPSYIYPNPGNYDITIIGTTQNGCNTRYFVNDGVQFTGLSASATASGNDTIAPYTVQLYSNATNATWYLWTFGDGDSSSLANPIHDFATSGPYTISLTIGNDSCVFTYDYPPITFGSSSLLSSSPVQANICGSSPSN
jgi:PKD repeat protein